MKKFKLSLVALGVAIGFLAATPARAQMFFSTFVDVFYLTPTDDQWQYPFSFNPGTSQTASLFGSVPSTQFNNRDGVMLVSWDLASQLPPGFPVGAYPIYSISVSVMAEPGGVWPSDPSADEWFTYDLNGDGQINADGVTRGHPNDTDGESSDYDPGRAIELYGVGFGPAYTLANWTENSPVIARSPFANTARDPFPMTFHPVTGSPLHVEDNVSGLWNGSANPPVTTFSPTPWAVGRAVNYTPGSQTTPFEIKFDIDLCHAEPHVKNYFQFALNQGRLILAFTSLREAFQGAPASNHPRIFTKEAVGVIPGAQAPRLRVTGILGTFIDSCF